MRGMLLVVISTVISLGFGLGLPSPASAKKPKPTACPAARYIVTQGAEVIIGDTAPRPAALVVGAGQITLGTCTLKAAAPKAKKSGTTTLTAKAKSCGSFSKLKFTATIQSGCQSLTGTVKAKKLKAQSFQARRSTCGDGVIDEGGGEACDGTGCAAGAACDETCHCLAPPTTTVTTTTLSTTATTSTTTTTLIGACTGAGTQCGLASECPVNEGCCGNGVRDIDETCDLGLQNCSSGQLCASDCTADCRLIGRCQGSGAQCTSAGDCPGGQGCCGDHTVDPGETCDDGNTVGGDTCPATCRIDACTPTAAGTLAVSVKYTGPPGTTISGIAVFVDYPETKVTQPVVSAAFGVSSSPRDLSYAFTEEALKLGGLPATFAHATFKTCTGGGTPAASEFTCSVTDASDDAGNVVSASALSCTVTIP